MMNLLKSLYVSSYITAAVAAAAFAFWQLRAGDASGWGLLLATLPIVLFFARLFIRPVARTSAHLLPLFACAAAGAALAWVLGGFGIAAMLALLVGVAGTAGYVFWYSRFESRHAPALTVGATLPAFTLTGVDGAPTLSTALLGRPGFWLFYRGNWCPLCMAQVREIAADYRALAARGVAVHLISPQPPSHTKALSSRFDAPMQFWVDQDNAAAKTLGIFAANGLPAGLQVFGYDADVPMPTVFITDSKGRVIYSDLTANYRVRPEPAEFLKVLDAAPLH